MFVCKCSEADSNVRECLCVKNDVSYREYTIVRASKYNIGAYTYVT